MAKKFCWRLLFQILKQFGVGKNRMKNGEVDKKEENAHKSKSRKNKMEDAKQFQVVIIGLPLISLDWR